MNIINGTTEFFSSEPSVVTIGKFDGLHIGHQFLLHRMLESDLKKIVFTFDTDTGHGKNVSEDDRLMSNELRREAFAKYNIDLLIECPFTDDIRCMDREVFLKQMLIERLNCKHLVVGSDFTFGYKALGDVDFLIANQNKYCYSIDVIDKIKYLDCDVSSTRIREELKKGQKQQVFEMLGESYCFVNGKNYNYFKKIKNNDEE